jgi:hypothetical protein
MTGSKIGTDLPWMVRKLLTSNGLFFETKTAAKEWIAWRLERHPKERYVLSFVSKSEYFAKEPADA